MPSICIDTNLLCLLVVGQFDRAAIARHRRLRAYSAADYDLLIAFANRFTAVITTPSILAETSNLLRQTAGSLGPSASRTLAALSRRFDDRNPACADVFEDAAYVRLGFTDAAILQLLPPDAMLLSDDLDLYLERARRGLPAVNFNHLREQRPIGA